jgi:exopolysaccharide biosynthesis polyprenyl glycosylphosphotransferase
MKPRLLLPAGDSLCLALAFLLSLSIRQSGLISSHFGTITYRNDQYLVSFLVAALLLVSIFNAFKLYQIRPIEFSARIFTVLKAVLVWVFILAALTYIIKFDFSRGVFFMTVGFGAVFITVCRYIIFRRRQNKTKNKELEAIIIGKGDRANSIEKLINNNLPKCTIKKLDFKSTHCQKLLRGYEPADIFLADEFLTREEVLSLLSRPEFSHHSFRVVLDVFKLATGEVRLNDIDEIPSISIRRNPGVIYEICKRLFDIGISFIGIIITLPLYVFIFLAIKADTKGPALIRQRRVGWNKKPFTLYKFRTMHCNSELYGLAPDNDDDPRVTRVGRILRRFSLDELPQLWNILKGDMSLVGPRPEMEFIVSKYSSWQNIRLHTKPGLTGLWQILGRKDIPLHENLEYDFYYVSNRSVLLDTVILLKTVPAVLFGRGAY